MPYVPANPPSDPRDVIRYLTQELHRLALLVQELESRLEALEP